ncbi:hypothetical protein HUJ04_001663 [Dendroctonus ponderosae]|nr:hypothetical protein HUJ04_001663 [Dendroctonus ponderosae]
MSVCVETSTTALIQPVVSPLSTSCNISEVVVSASTVQNSSTIGVCVDNNSTNELKPDQLVGKNIAKLVVTTQQHGAPNSNQVLQKVVSSPLITVLNSTGPLTVVKSLCVTSVVSSTPQYTLVNTTAPLNVTNTLGKPPTITVLNCGSLASPVTVVKAISTQQALPEKPQLEISPVPNAIPIVSSTVIENRGHNVFVKNTCPDSTVPDSSSQSHKFLTAPNFTSGNILSNIPTVAKSAPANGQRNKMKILGNVQIATSSPQNVMLNKNANLAQPKYNVAARQKFVSVNSGPIKYIQKSSNNVLTPIINPTLKSPTEKSGKLCHPLSAPMHKGPVKSLPPNIYLPKPPQGIKTLPPQLKNIPGHIQRTGSGLRTIPPQRPQKLPTKPNYIGKHAVQAQKAKQQIHPKLRTSSTYNNTQTPMTEKQLTFNQVLTAQIIETLSKPSTPPPSNRYEILPARYDNAFNCPDKQMQATINIDSTKKSGLDTLSLICHAVMLDHNYNATLPPDSPPRPAPTVIAQAQVNGIPSPSMYSGVPSKRRIVTSPNALPVPSQLSVSLSTSNNSSALLTAHVPRDDDAASDVSDNSDRKHDTEGEETDTAPEVEDVRNEDHYGDYVTRCICGFLHDDGYMVECDKCKVWQHVQCVLKNRQIPDEYLCELCDPSKPVDRQKARMIQQQWIRDRQLMEPKLRKEAKLKETLRNKEHMSDSDSSDGEQAVRSNMAPKNRALSALGRRKLESLKINKKDGKEPLQRRQKRKEKKIIKRKVKQPIKQPAQQSHSDDENQDTGSSQMPQLRLWIENYEEAVTNHYSPELRARISSIRVNGSHLDSRVTYDSTVCKCRIHTQPLTEIKYLVSTAQLSPNTPVIELRGKYMLSTQHRNSGGSLTTRQHTQKPGPFLFFYRLHKDNTEVCVDTRTYGNSARFIRRSCRPNAELRHCIEKGVLHLYIVCIASVEKNCELTIKHESHDLASVGTTHIACACGRPDECAVNKTTIKKNGDASEARKRRGRRTMSSSGPAFSLKSPLKEQPPSPAEEPPIPPQQPVLEEEEKQKKEDIDELPEPAVEESKESINNCEEKCQVAEQVEIKVEMKEEPLLPVSVDQITSETIEIKNEEPECEEKCRSPSPQPTKVVEIDNEKPIKEEKIKSPPTTPISTRRSSHQKSDKEEKDAGKEVEIKEKPSKSSSKKLSREERKLEAILRAIEQMEKADQKKQEHQAKQANRRESEPGPTPKEEEKTEPKMKRRRRRGRARTTSTNAQSRRSRLNSTDSYMTSGDENLLSPTDSLHSNRQSEKEENSKTKAAGVLLSLSNGESGNKKFSTADHDSNSNSAHSSPETPHLSSACLLVQAAVEPLESGFKFPKTKKGLMNEWLNKTPDTIQAASSISPASLFPQLNQMVDESTNSNKHLSAFGDSPSQRDSPTISEAVAPPKKRKLPRESLSNDNSPPTTPTSTGPPKSIDTPRSSQEGSVEIAYSGAEGDSPSYAMESDAELKERASQMKQEFGKSVILSSVEPISNNVVSFLDPRLTREHSMFCNSDHLVGTVEKTLSIFGFQSTRTEMSNPAKRKLSITEYRQRKKLNTDRSDEQDMENDFQGNDDNNSSESFKNELSSKPRSRSSSSSSFSSLEDMPASDIVMKSSAFNSEPTELERQRELSNLRLKKAFGLALDDEPRKPVIDMTAILNCEIESTIIPQTPLPTNVIALASLSELSMSPTLRATITPDRAYTPVLPPMREPVKSPSPVKEIETGQEPEVYVQREENVETVQEDQPHVVMQEESEDKTVETKDSKEGEEKTNLFYDPDDDERPAVVLEEPVDAKYVPPFNNPVYPNSNFNFASTIDDDSRYRSRNPSPPPNLGAEPFSSS